MSSKISHDSSKKFRQTKKSKKQTTFNEEVINNNQKKYKFLSKLVNKIVKVTNKDFSLRNLKNCVIRNFENMQDRIEKCDHNSNAVDVSSKKRASCSTNNLNSPKSLKISKSDKGRTSKSKANSIIDACSSSNRTNLTRISEESYNRSGCSSKKNEIADIKNKIESDDTYNERTKLIRKLVNQQKLKLSLTTDDDIDDSDSEMREVKGLSKMQIAAKRSLMKIKQLRKLPDYEKIDQLLNTPQTSYYKKHLYHSLNTIPNYKTEVVEHWNTYSFLTKKIEHCVLNKEWNNLTKLLILLADASKSYKPCFLKTTLINILCNPATQDEGSMLEEFLKSCYSCQSDFDIAEVLTDLFHIKNGEKEGEETADEGL